MTDIAARYTEFYRSREPRHVYPVEFVVRAYLGAYPRLSRSTEPHAGKRVLDIGFGDGRNMPLLADLGLTVYGTEVSQDVCDRTTARLIRLGITVDARVGKNHQLPFDDAFFDEVLACHSCYYVDPGTRFADNAREIARVMKHNGRWVFSAPMTSSYILRGARDLGDRHLQVTADPYGLRNGYILKAFASADEIERALCDWFEDFHVGSCRNDWWGIDEHVWIVVCKRTHGR